MRLSSSNVRPRGMFGLIVAAAGLLWAADGEAGVTSSSRVESYLVSGTTADGLVSYMRNHPYQGDAVAHIRPTYSLTVATKESGGACKAGSVGLKIRFLVTLPQAASPSGLSPATRSAWDNFVAFARRHEETHRSIYLQCADDFVARAMRLASSSCSTLQATISSLLDTEKRACDLRQNAFDREQYRAVLQLNLFAMAKYPGRKPALTTPVSGPFSALAAPH